MTDPSACCPSRKADPAGALFRTSARVIYDKYVISPDRIADIVAFAVDAPEERVINEFTIGPANQPW